VAGTLYIGAAAMAFVLLRGFEPFGFLSIIWAALVVVAADVGGYFAGRMIGGPKLWPAVSPNKTWAGLIGGIVLAMLVGFVFSGATTGTYFYQVGTVSALAALLAQAGDLAESALKRRFGVKDAGTLMPGHGGLLDRLDGHMVAILVAAALTFTRGQAVFIW
jgi:phosphatidate cytidylyltransferase